MENKDFGKLMEARTKNFALQIIKLSASLSNSIEDKVIRNQIVKSGTSIGANYREANRSRSRADFKNRISICQSEANETLYWLELILESNNIENNERLKIYYEAKELLAIFTSIITKMNK